MNETPTTDEEKYLEYGRALRSAVDEAISPWLTSTLQERNNGQALPAEIVDAIAEVRVTALANITKLIEAEVSAPLSGPLEQIRRAVTPLGAILDEHDFDRPRRDPQDEEMRPEDVHGLGPLSFMDLGEQVQVAGISWGAAKAHLHMKGR